ncbi:hypothetical protein R3P38DRAFT_3419980 [Favolaschia claudopus]|uniref:Uncharacterized protein n=1 Tax=Favolaschia claudopus TaxID=2862362 RepID=A0AAW0EJW6_9AGAR
MSVMSSLITPWIQALWRVVCLLFGRSVDAVDVESGKPFEVNFPAKSQENALTDVPTFEPILAGVPALTLATMAVGAAIAPQVPVHVNKVYVHDPRSIPVIIITPPSDDPVTIPDDSCTSRRLPLRSIANLPRRVHGKAVRAPRAAEKENLRDHPNTPRLTHHLVTEKPTSQGSISRSASQIIDNVMVAKPGSGAWEREKAAHLDQAKAWTRQIQDRRRSLPEPPLPPPASASAHISRRHSAPARLSLSERLNRLVKSGCASPPAPAVLPLWGDANVSFIIDGDGDDKRHGLSPSPSGSTSASSSGGSISSLLDALETDLKSPLWLGLEDFETALEEGRLSLEGRTTSYSPPSPPSSPRPAHTVDWHRLWQRRTDTRELSAFPPSSCVAPYDEKRNQSTDHPSVDKPENTHKTIEKNAEKDR